MQLQDFTREILVEATAAVDAGRRLGPDRTGVIQVHQHRRMRFDGEQHVRKAAKDVRADRLALVGAGQRAYLVGGHAEMVRPEPDQPFGKTELGHERSVETRFRLFEVDLLRNGGSRVGLRCRRRLGLGVLLHAGYRRGGSGSRRRGLALRLALGALDEARGLALLPEIEHGARRLAGGEKVRIGQAAGAGAIEFGDERAARIGGDRRNGARARTKAKSMQRERGLCFRIESHGHPDRRCQIMRESRVETAAAQDQGDKHDQ